MIVRPLGKADLSETSYMWLRMMAEVAPGTKPNRQYFMDYTSEFLGTAAYRGFVAVEQGEIVGFVDGFAYVDPVKGRAVGQGRSFYILPEYRNGSVSFRLFRRILEAMKEKEIFDVELLCYEKTLPFWAKKGFMLEDKICLSRRF